MNYLTVIVYSKCVDVVREIVDERVKEDYPNPEEEQVELRRMGAEIEEWVKLAGLLLEQTDTPETLEQTSQDGVIEENDEKKVY